MTTTWSYYNVLGWFVRWSREREGRAWAGRVSVSPGPDECSVASVYYHVPYEGCGVALNIGQDERALGIMLALPPVGLWLSTDGRAAHRVALKLIDALPIDGGRCSGREFSVRLFDGGVHWKVGADDMGWSSKTPRWRDGSWRPLGFKKQQSSEVVEERDVLVPMPERAYRGHAKLTRERWGHDRLPRLFDSTLTRVSIDMHPGEQVPFPGKGENSWDQGEDGTYSSCGPAHSIEEGVGQLVASTLERRRRHGGRDWRPAPRSVEASA